MSPIADSIHPPRRVPSDPPLGANDRATKSMLDSLQSVRQRVRGLGVARGAARSVAAAIGLLIFYLIADYLLNLPPASRTILMIGVVAAVAIALMKWVAAPLAARLSLSDIAGRLEMRFPQFEDRLRSSIDFVRADTPGSSLMKQRAVAEALAEAGRVDFRDAIDARPAWMAASQAGGAIVLALLIAWAAGPRVRATAWAHLFDPMSHRPWPRSVEIAAAGDVPNRVPVGQPIDVRMKLLRGDRSSMRATLCYRYDNGPVQQQVMTRGEGGTYSASLDPRIDPNEHGGALHAVLHAWIKAGDDQLDLAPVTVVPRLAVESVEARVTPPAYATGEPAVSTNLAAAPASMIEGSSVELRLTFNKPLARHGAAPAIQVEPFTPAGDASSDSTRGSHGPGTAPAQAIPAQGTLAQGTLAQGTLAQGTPIQATPVLAWTAPTSLTATGRFDATRSLHFHLHATDTDGFSNTGLEEYELIVRPDQLPSIQIEEPRENEERTAVASIPLRALAEDDLGIRDVSLIVDRLQRGGDQGSGAESGRAAGPTTAPGDALMHWTIPLVVAGRAQPDVDWTAVQGTGERKRFRAIESWDLASLKNADLHSGDLLEYHLTVTDNYSVNGRTHPPVSSGRLRISIISQEDLTNRAIARFQSAKNQISALKSTEARIRQETSNLRDDLKRKPTLDDADRAAAQRLAAEQSSAAAEGHQIADTVAAIGKELAENKSQQRDLQTLSHDVAGDLNSAADDAMKSATQQLNDLPGLPTAKQRDAQLADTRAKQDQAGETMQRALDRMGDIGSLPQTIARINELLKQQREVGQQTRAAGKTAIGKTPDQLTPEERKQLDAAADQQARLAEQTAKTIADMQKAAAQLAKSDPVAAEAMSKAAATASSQQVSSSQKKASRQARDNQQSAAQSAQQQAELGLQMMAADLQQAEQRKLAELSKQLQDLQDQIANLIRRQAGHNLDNLAAQGPVALKVASTQPDGERAGMMLADLKSLADRGGASPTAGPAPNDAADIEKLIPTLAPSQEQTSSNTRDISKSSESMPDGAAAASQLLRAADHMDRAIIALRDSRFAAAYDPSQVEALEVLRSAKNTVDQQKAKVDQQINQAQKEAVRRQYVKLKADQQKLNAEVNRIDQMRDAGTPLKRIDAIRLGQLPGEQGALADRVNALDKHLASVGSIVYLWANHDIANGMTDVKGNLPDASKDAQTLATQDRIVGELDEMIKNLAIKPEVSKFAAEGNGGGGGGGGGQSGAAPLPTEAELRLLRALQRAVNTQTSALDAAGKNDAPQAAERAANLGNRQGELRKLLSQVLEKSSHGQLKLGPEPDNRDQLPEEASQQDVENQELDQSLLNDKPTTEDEEKESNLIGDRMARSRQRLALNDDPGKVTQLFQQKILQDMDSMIEQARKREAEMRNPPKSKGGSPQQQTTPQQSVAKGEQPKPGSGQRKPGKPSAAPAQVSANTPPGGGAPDLSKQIKESLAEWGQVTPRLRAAQIEGSSETILEQYRKLTEDYYRSMAAKAAQH